VLALVWTGMLFVLNDRVVASANQHADTLDRVIRDLPPRATHVIENRHWLATSDGDVYHYQYYDQRERRLHGLSVYQPAPTGDFRLLSHTHADTVTFRDGRWVATRGWVQTFPTRGTSERRVFQQQELDLQDPAFFAGAQVEASVMTFAQLREYIRQRTDSGVSLAEQRMDLQRKVAFPVVPIVMTLIAVPFGVTTGRRGALYGIGLAIVLAFSYFLVLAFFAAAGRAGVLPSWLAAWAANILFGAAALYLTLRVRT
jgi:lipopolysaccharide export LptBFGC system permease protein LptF